MNNMPKGAHDYEPSDQTHRMHTDPACAACGQPKNSRGHS